MDSSQRGGQQLVSLKRRCSLRDWTAGRLVTAFAEAIVPDVGNYLQIDDRHLLVRKLSSSLASLIWGEIGKEGPEEVTPTHAPWWSTNHTWPRGGLAGQGLSIWSLSAPCAKDPRRAHRMVERWRSSGGIKFWLKHKALCAINSPSRLLLVTDSDYSRDPKFETWLCTLIIIKSQTGNFPTMSCWLRWRQRLRKEWAERGQEREIPPMPPWTNKNHESP
jgi:hypothetical protein